MSLAPRVEGLAGCPVCGSQSSSRRFESPDLLMGVPGTYSYEECRSCGTVFQNPRVIEPDLPLVYPERYHTHEGGTEWRPSPAPMGSLRDGLRRAIRCRSDGTAAPELSAALRLAGRVLSCSSAVRRRARLGLFEPLEPPRSGSGRCLEVGPGVGIELYGLREIGWQAFGLEVDPLAAERARGTSGCEVRVGTLETTDYPDGSFDLVYMSHVFEHLPRPRQALVRCRELLRAGGRLVLVYPNPRALTARVYGRFACVFEPPRHLVLAPAATVSSLVADAGFDEVRTSTTARHARRYATASRVLRSGRGWDWTRPAPARVEDGLLALVESALVLARFDAGEEVLVQARRTG